MNSKKKSLKRHVKKSSVARTFIIGIVLLSTLFAILWLSVLKPIAMKREVEYKLNNAEVQLRLTFNAVISKIGSEVIGEPKPPMKICSEQSVKIGRGNISCSVTFNITAKSATNLKRYTEILHTLLEQQKPQIVEVTNTEYIEVSSPSGSGGQFAFKYRGTNLDCGVWNHSYTNTDTVNILAWCRQDVPSFLPGYTVIE